MTENQTDIRDNQERMVKLSELEEGVRLPHEKPRRSHRRRMLIAVMALLILVAGASIAAYHLLHGRKVDLKANKKLPEKVASGSDIKQAAFDSISGSLSDPIAKPSPAVDAAGVGPEQSPAAAKPAETRSEIAPAPIQPGIAATLEPPPEVMLANRGNSAGQRYAQPASTQSTNDSAVAGIASSKANNARSIRYSQTVRPETIVKPEAKAGERKAYDNGNQPARLIRQDAKPSFGAMLPVRLMGVLYTLRVGSLARLELARDLKTENWQLKRGTIFIGNVVSGDLDRAYLQIKGFIDPDSQGFVKLEGEVLGNDGGAGLRGRKRSISPVWVKLLDRAAQAGVQIATGVLSRGNSSVIVASDPYGAYRSTTGPGELSERNRSFVEVPAGAMGFVLVTTLPESNKSDLRFAGNATGEEELTDQQLAELMTEGDPERIRAALPKMNPELQRIAQTVLNETESKKP